MTLRNGLSNEMEMNINVFGVTVECGILGEMNGSLVVAIKCCGNCEIENRRKFNK